jgi:hypothetical protein
MYSSVGAAPRRVSVAPNMVIAQLKSSSACSERRASIVQALESSKELWMGYIVAARRSP